MATVGDTATAKKATASNQLRWWRELGLILGFYLVYSWVRNQFGSASVSSDQAFSNAETVIDIQEAIRLYVEPDIQSWFVDWGWFLRFWNIYYGTLHFVVTAGVMLYLYLRQPADYPKWRTIGLATTGLALVGFAAFPLMPPRLLGDCGEFGACVASPFVDTVAVHGGWVSMSSGAMEAVSNQYAAMPSLHFGWSMWCFLAMRPHLRSTPAKVAMALYPWLTLFAIIVTANHYWIDAVGGLVVLGLGWLLGTALNNRFGPKTAVLDPLTGQGTGNGDTVGQ